MGWLDRQQEMKLDILESLARSQKALARIIESAADSAPAGAEAGTPDGLQKSIGAIARYQQAIMEKMFGIRVGTVRTTPPAAPWTNETLHVAPLYEKSGAAQQQEHPSRSE